MRITRLPLLWRVFAINATLLVFATIVLVVARNSAVVEGLDVALVLVVMLAANFLLLRHALNPIERLAARMRTVDLLRPGQRLAERGSPEVTEVVAVFNEMLDRLEDERRESGRRALRAQEDERARIARELRPEMLEELGLASALTELSRRFAEQSGLRIEHRFAEDLPPLSEDAELALYRVAQESLTNVARHAAASRVELALEGGAGSVVLRVVDDGRGMDERAAQNGHGGLRGMRERAVLVGGALAVKPSREGGVEVRLEVPAAKR